MSDDDRTDTAQAGSGEAVSGVAGEAAGGGAAAAAGTSAQPSLSVSEHEVELQRASEEVGAAVHEHHALAEFIVTAFPEEEANSTADGSPMNTAIRLLSQYKTLNVQTDAVTAAGNTQGPPAGSSGFTRRWWARYRR